MLENGKESKWTKKNNSSSFTTGRTVYSFSIDVVEDELITIESLEIDGMSFVPDYYSEKTSSNAIIIEGIVKLSMDIANKFREDMLSTKTYFNVVRHGIDENIKKMRFGRILEWCPSVSEEAIYQAFNLVEDVYDEVKSIKLPEMERTDKLTLENILLKKQMKFIFDKMVMNGIISKEEQSIFENATNDKLKMNLFDYTKQENIEALKEKME